MPKTYSEKQSRRTVVMAAVTLALAATAVIAKAALRAFDIDDEGWVALGFVLLAFSAVFVLGVQFWRGLDDMQRQGHAVSWYWGSVGGLAVTACLIVVTGKSHSEFTLGVATLMVMQLGCSLILYGFWWLKGRGFSIRSGE